MQIPKILELLIAMALIYFLFSTLVSIIFEWYNYKTQKRGRFLHEVILKLLNDSLNQSYGSTLYTHYSIDKLKKNKDSFPQYISSSMFADVLIDIIGTQSEEINFVQKFATDGSKNLVNIDLEEKRITDPYVRFTEGVNKMKYSPLKSQLRSFHEKSTNYNELKTLIASWYDDYMSRVTGWYKNGTQKTLFYISLFVALIFNVDSIRLVKKLNQDDTLRTNLVTAAKKKITENESSSIVIDSSRLNNKSEYLKKIIELNVIKDSVNLVTINKLDSLVKVIEDDGIPIGYHGDLKKTHGSYYFLVWLVGILISAYALSFGAPFWFEVINKFVNVRRSGKTH